MDWKPTGRTRNRCIWFGLLAYAVEDTRMVNTWMPGAPHNPGDPATVLQVIQHLQAQIEAQSPRLAALDRLEGAEGSRCITDTAKLLKMSRDALTRWMVEHRWIYRRPNSDTWTAYRDKEQALLLEHVPYHYSGRDGSPRVTMRLLVTPKGLAKLAALLERQIES